MGPVGHSIKTSERFAVLILLPCKVLKSTLITETQQLTNITLTSLTPDLYTISQQHTKSTRPLKIELQKHSKHIFPAGNPSACVATLLVSRPRASRPRESIGAGNERGSCLAGPVRSVDAIILRLHIYLLRRTDFLQGLCVGDCCLQRW